MVVGTVNPNQSSTAPLPSNILKDYDPQDLPFILPKEGQMDAVELYEYEKKRDEIRYHRKQLNLVEQGLMSKEPTHWLPQIHASIPAKIFTILDRPNSCILGRIMGFFILVTIIGSVVLFILSTLEEMRSKTEDRSRTPLFNITEEVSVWIFFLDYITRLFTVAFVPTVYLRFDGYSIPLVTQNETCLRSSQIQILYKLYYFIFDFLNIIDLLSCIPIISIISGSIHYELFIVKIIRLTRGFRLAKMGHLKEDLWWFRETINKSRAVLVVVFFLIIVVTFLFASAILLAEQGDYNEEKGYFERMDLYGTGKERSPFTTMAVCTWWVVCTATGVGYGDIYPTTDLGRFIGILCMYGGILGLALPVATMALDLGETKYVLDDENRLLKVNSLPWDERKSPQRLVHSFDEMTELCSEMLKLNKAMRFWAGDTEESNLEADRSVCSMTLQRQNHSHDLTGNEEKQFLEEKKNDDAVITPPGEQQQQAQCTGSAAPTTNNLSKSCRRPSDHSIALHKRVGGRKERAEGGEHALSVDDTASSNSPVSTASIPDIGFERKCPPTQHHHQHQSVVVATTATTPRNQAAGSVKIQYRKCNDHEEHAAAGADVCLESNRRRLSNIEQKKRSRINYGSSTNNNGTSAGASSMTSPQREHLGSGGGEIKGRSGKDYLMPNRIRRNLQANNRGRMRRKHSTYYATRTGKRPLPDAGKIHNIIRLTEQSNLLLGFSDLLLTRTKATIVSKIFDEERHPGKFKFSCPRWLRCCRNNDESKAEECNKPWGWEYEICKHHMRLKLEYSKVIISLSTRAILGLTDQAQEAGFYDINPAVPSRKTSGANEGVSSIDDPL